MKPEFSLESSIEAILFFRGEPVAIKKLAELLEKTVEEIDDALNTLEKALGGRGIVLVRDDKEVMLETAPEASEIIQKVTKEELIKDIGKAGLETLSLVIYHGPISRREIDYVRGVNSGFILRNLLVRGLIEKSEAKEGERSFVYKPTFELLSYLGIKKKEELPEYEEVRREIAEFREKTEATQSVEKHE